MIGCFAVCSQWLSDGTGSTACHHHDWQTNHQQRAGDCYTVSNELTIRLRALVFYERIVNEAQPS